MTVNAWQSWTNSHGGIGGHPVNVVVQDDRGDVATSTADVNGLAGDHSVLALIDDTSYDTAWASTPGPAGLPVICGSETGNGFTCQSNPSFIPTGNTVIAGVYGQTLVSQLLKKPKFGVVYCSELAACAQAIPLNKKFASGQGVQVVYAQAASTSAPDYTAQCVGLRDAGAQVVFGYAGQTKIAADCARQGYHPVWVVAQGAIAAQYRKNANFDGTVGPLGTWPWFVDSTPAQHAFHQAMAQYWPNFDQFTSPYTATSTWAALELFKAAAAKAGPNPTRQDIMNGIYSLGPGFTLDGLIPPETLTQGKPTINPCFYEIGIKNQQYVTPFGTQTFCQPAS
jgi:branched-chain amino acid transport system substrate-binding protein